MQPTQMYNLLLERYIGPQIEFCHVFITVKDTQTRSIEVIRSWLLNARVVSKTVMSDIRKPRLSANLSESSCLQDFLDVGANGSLGHSHNAGHLQFAVEQNSVLATAGNLFCGYNSAKTSEVRSFKSLSKSHIRHQSFLFCHSQERLQYSTPNGICFSLTIVKMFFSTICA